MLSDKEPERVDMIKQETHHRKLSLDRRKRKEWVSATRKVSKNAVLGVRMSVKTGNARFKADAKRHTGGQT